MLRTGGSTLTQDFSGCPYIVTDGRGCGRHEPADQSFRRAQIANEMALADKTLKSSAA